jgi:hypothetical protein
MIYMTRVYYHFIDNVEERAEQIPAGNLWSE